MFRSIGLGIGIKADQTKLCQTFIGQVPNNLDEEVKTTKPSRLVEPVCHFLPLRQWCVLLKPYEHVTSGNLQQSVGAYRAGIMVCAFLFHSHKTIVRHNVMNNIY